MHARDRGRGRNTLGRMSREWIAYLERTAPGATQKALAEAAGVDQSTVSRWRRGQGEPAPETAIRLARKIGAEPLGALVAAGHLTPAEARAIVSHHEHGSITDAELLEILAARLAGTRGRETDGRAPAATMQARGSRADVEVDEVQERILAALDQYWRDADRARNRRGATPLDRSAELERLREIAVTQVTEALEVLRPGTARNVL